MSEHTSRVVPVIVSAAFVAVLVSPTTADARDPLQAVVATAKGQIVAQAPCGPTTVCQTSVLSGRSTPFGPFDAVLEERIDITTGAYTGSAVLTLRNGTLTTTSTGQVTQPNVAGAVLFVERHQVVDGTGRFAGASGEFLVLGTADAAGRLTAVIVGSLGM